MLLLSRTFPRAIGFCGFCQNNQRIRQRNDIQNCTLPSATHNYLRSRRDSTHLPQQKTLMPLWLLSLLISPNHCHTTWDDRQAELRQQRKRKGAGKLFYRHCGKVGQRHMQR
ncbi:hypothetical protein Ddc_07673 [Ditylenchus destructor]|nr:hypothetical protein Ddc_07673 [Ditylenchus destructor]